MRAGTPSSSSSSRGGLRHESIGVEVRLPPRPALEDWRSGDEGGDEERDACGGEAGGGAVSFVSVSTSIQETELMAGGARLVKDHGVEAHIVRWPVNKEAPFEMEVPQGITVHERGDFNDTSLRRFVNNLKPNIVLTSGWVDRTYLQVCRDVHKRGVPTVM